MVSLDCPDAGEHHMPSHTTQQYRMDIGEGVLVASWKVGEETEDAEDFGAVWGWHDGVFTM